MKNILNRKPVIITLITLIIAFIGIVFYFKFHVSKGLTELESVFKITGIFFAALFFAYKLFTGWLILNLNVELKKERQVAADGSGDHLAITVVLSKGTTDSVWLHNIVVRVTASGGAPQLIYPVGMQRLDPDVKLWKDEGKGRLLNIAPGETVSFSAYALVPSGTVVELEAVVFGTRPFYNLESTNDAPIQWKSSTIILPV